VQTKGIALRAKGTTVEVLERDQSCPTRGERPRTRMKEEVKELWNRGINRGGARRARRHILTLISGGR
jgi:hypothetical protein